jgi:tRNA pseudouridine13 synthase
MIIKHIPEDFIVEEISSLEPGKTGEYAYFLLKKRDYNTESAILKISEHFRIPRKRFGYAGTKDRRAVTYQYASVNGKIKDMDFGNFSVKVVGYGNNPISLGDLAGNKFRIVVRDIEKKPEPVDFIINYFDEQRFGKRNLEIGMAILKDDYEKAANLIDLPDVKAHLDKNTKDYVGAVRKAPFRILSMYIHAVQSFLWNEAAARLAGGQIKVPYEHGVFVFPEKAQNTDIPLMAFDTEIPDKDTYSEIMKEHGLAQRDFVIRKVPELTPIGAGRQLVSEVKNLNLSELQEDEFFPGKKTIAVSFELGKGSYATIVIKRMFA